MSEPLMRLLADLPAAEPDRAMAERIRMRCQARLSRQAPRISASSADAAGARTMQAWQPAVAALGVVYLTEVLVQALRLYNLR